MYLFTYAAFTDPSYISEVCSGTPKRFGVGLGQVDGYHISFCTRCERYGGMASLIAFPGKRVMGVVWEFDDKYEDEIVEFFSTHGNYELREHDIQFAHLDGGQTFLRAWVPIAPPRRRTWPMTAEYHKATLGGFEAALTP